MPKYKIIPPIICLCLDKRKEHWKELQRQAELLGLDFTPYICGNGEDSELKYNQIDEVNPDVSGWMYSAPGHQINHYNALNGHKGMIALAKERGLDSVLLMEDDSLFLQRFDQVVSTLEKYDEWVEYLRKFHLVYLGWWRGSETDEFNLAVEENYKTYKNIVGLEIIPGDGVGGLHGCIIRKELYDLILSCPMNDPLDSQFNRNRANIPSLIICPKIIHTKDMYSYCEGINLCRKRLDD